MKKEPRISDAEWQVMKVLWKRSPLATNEVVEALTPVTEWKPKTIMTMLNRLVKKGALGFEKQGRTHVYTPLAGEADCVQAESRSFLRRVYGGAVKPMLVNFLEGAELSEGEIEELRRILEKKEKGS